MKKYKLFDLSHYVGLYSEGGYIEIRDVYEKDSTRTIYNGKKELLLIWDRA